MGVVRGVARDWKEVLWGREFSQDRDAMYKKMVGAIEATIDKMYVRTTLAAA